MKQQILSNNAPTPIGPYSQAIKSGNMIFISGQIAINPKTNELVNENIQQETEMVMKNIYNILNECNCTFNNVVKCSIFLSNMDLFKHVNEVYGSYFNEPYPARETVEVSCLPKNVNIEISAIAICK
ncbi:MAG: reactive intermediate/imine deaminase [Flavobacteriales bacterium]|nr:reactive intermediate/imine deaminase [Flavobacteriales bacterium]|tara:strand:+ start:697 stop:1077 length:381 start_codon:yes stop_codon:yes gene_type:complete